MAAAEVSHHALFHTLDTAVKDTNFARVAHAADEVLKVLPNDKDALQCKLVALIRQSSFEDAIALIDGHGSLSSNKAFEKAFCHFRLQRMPEALAILDSQKGEAGLHERELRAQLLYRMEKYEEAATTYEGLAGGDDDEFQQEHITNRLASLAGRLASEAVPPAIELPDGSDEYEMFEQTYNTTCILLALGRVKQALDFVLKSLEQCRAILESEPDIDEDEIEDELALLQVQHGVVLMSMGSNAEAMARFTHVLKRKPDDITVAALASINIIALNKEHGIFDSRKKLAAVAVEGLDKKLTSAQRRSIGVNHALLLMHMRQNDACRKKVDELKSEFPDSDLPGLIRAYSLRAKPDQALQCLEEYAAANPDSSERVRLTMAQMAIGQGDAAKAIGILQGIPTLQHQPGIVGVLVTMYTDKGEVLEACGVLDTAIAYWKGHGNSANALQLLRAAAAYKYARSMFKEAGALYTAILEEDPQDGDALTKLITCLAEYDIEEAEKYGEQLPPLEFEGAPVDVDLLEKANVRKTVRKIVTKEGDVATAGAPAPGPDVAAAAAGRSGPGSCRRTSIPTSRRTRNGGCRDGTGPSSRRSTEKRPASTTWSVAVPKARPSVPPPRRLWPSSTSQTPPPPPPPPTLGPTPAARVVHLARYRRPGRLRPRRSRRWRCLRRRLPRTTRNSRQARRKRRTRRKSSGAYRYCQLPSAPKGDQ